MACAISRIHQGMTLQAEVLVLRLFALCRRFVESKPEATLVLILRQFQFCSGELKKSVFLWDSALRIEDVGSLLVTVCVLCVASIRLERQAGRRLDACAMHAGWAGERGYDTYIYIA